MGSAKGRKATLFLILIAASLLLIIGSWLSYTSTLDTATIGLMSVNILEGERPLFYYGQAYFGALEAYVAAFFVAVFGFSEFAVSLAPILFSVLWVLFTYLLFRRILSSSAGLIAATVTAFSGYYVFWYSISTYGGYSAIVCLGTVAIWLSLVVFQDNPKGRGLFGYCACIGVVFALSLWVHALTYPYLIVSALILLLYLIKKRFRSEVLVPLLFSGCISLVGFLPVYFETGSLFGGLSERAELSLPRIQEALSVLFNVNIFELVVWNYLLPAGHDNLYYTVAYGSLVVLIAVAILAITAFFPLKKEVPHKVYYAIPFSFCTIFLALLIQHHMATVKAPRYAIGFWSMLLCSMWSLSISGQKRLLLRRVAIGLFCLWIGIQLTGTILFISGSSDSVRREQSVIAKIVKTAENHDLRSILVYGDRLLGYKAQKLSMFSRNRIIFANAEEERYGRNAQRIELDEHRGYLTDGQSKGPLKNLFEDLNIDYSETQIAQYTLFSEVSFRGQNKQLASLTYELIQGDDAQSNLNVLSDSNQDTGVTFNYSDRIQIDLRIEEVHPVSALLLYSPQNPFSYSWQRFSDFSVSVSMDGNNYKKVFETRSKTANGFLIGESKLFLGGPFGRTDIYFPPVDARYIRLQFKKIPQFSLAEIVVMGEGGSESESFHDNPAIQDLIKIIKENDLQFVYADRWVSARLLKVFAGTPKSDIALSRHSSKYANRPLKYFIKPEKGRALVCNRNVAEKCRSTLTDEFGGNIITTDAAIGEYCVFLLNDVDVDWFETSRSGLIWTGTLPLKTEDIELLAPWLYSLGLPIWRRDYVRTQGIYRDSWTNGDGRYYGLDYSIDRAHDFELAIVTHGWRPASDAESIKLKVTANGNIQLPFKEKEEDSYYFMIPKILGKIESIEISSTTFIPPGSDQRTLGLDIKQIEVRGEK